MSNYLKINFASLRMDEMEHFADIEIEDSYVSFYLSRDNNKFFGEKNNIVNILHDLIINILIIELNIRDINISALNVKCENIILVNRTINKNDNVRQEK
jgi:hypothetical protein